MEAGGLKGPVCVTGATGYMASWLIMRLLQLGYTVRATIRPPQDGKERDLSFLKNLPNAREKLRMFTADLNDPESFSEAIRGCRGVFHMAEVMNFEDDEPEQVVTQRAMKAVLAILRASLESKTVQRVVYTASSSAVGVNATGATLMDESYWTDVDYIRATMMQGGKTYTISKILTEKAALESGETNGLDVVTVVAPFICGPFMCNKLPASVRISMSMIYGDQEDPEHRALRTSLVHVDDLATAHIFLFEHPSAKGRYICSPVVYTPEKMANFLTEKYPDQFPVPSPDQLKQMSGYETPDFSSKKLLDLGFKFKHGFEDIYDGAIQCCRQKGYL